MILDTLNQFHTYQSLNPLFSKVVSFLQENKLETLPLGRHIIQGEDLFVNIVDSPTKTEDEARLETHDRMIDIQIPISASERHGYTPRRCLAEMPYIANDDITFYDGKASRYYDVMPGEFVIYFPEDGHAPAITATGLRKAIFKVRNINE